MESLYIYFLYDLGVHPAMASILAFTVPALLVGGSLGMFLACGLAFGRAIAISGLGLTYKALRLATALIKMPKLPRRAKRTASADKVDSNSGWLKYDDPTFLRGVMVTNKEEIS